VQAEGVGSRDVDEVDPMEETSQSDRARSVDSDGLGELRLDQGCVVEVHRLDSSSESGNKEHAEPKRLSSFAGSSRGPNDRIDDARRPPDIAWLSRCAACGTIARRMGQG